MPWWKTLHPGNAFKSQSPFMDLLACAGLPALCLRRNGRWEPMYK